MIIKLCKETRHDKLKKLVSDHFFFLADKRLLDLKNYVQYRKICNEKIILVDNFLIAY